MTMSGISRGVFAAFAIFGVIMAIYLAADAALQRPGLLRIDAARAATLSADYSQDARNTPPLPRLDPAIIEAAVADAEELRLTTPPRDGESAPGADETSGEPPAADKERAPKTREVFPTSKPVSAATPGARPTHTPLPRATETSEPKDTPEPEPTDTPEPEPTDTPEPKPTDTPTRVPTKTRIVCVPGVIETNGCPKATPTPTPKPRRTPAPTPIISDVIDCVIHPLKCVL